MKHALILLFCLALIGACSPPKQTGLVFTNDLETIKGWQSIQLARWPVHGGWFSNKMDTAASFGVLFKLPFRAISPSRLQKVRVTLWAYFTDKNSATLVMELKDKKDNQLSWSGIRMDDQIKALFKWQKITAEFSLPKDFTGNPDNRVAIYPWDEGGKDLYVDDVTIEFMPERK